MVLLPGKEIERSTFEESHFLLAALQCSLHTGARANSNYVAPFLLAPPQTPVMSATKPQAQMITHTMCSNSARPTRLHLNFVPLCTLAHLLGPPWPPLQSLVIPQPLLTLCSCCWSPPSSTFLDLFVSGILKAQPRLFLPIFRSPKFSSILPSKEFALLPLPVTTCTFSFSLSYGFPRFVFAYFESALALGHRP